MKVSVLQENLAKSLSIVGKAVEGRPTMPVLSNILLKTEDARLKLVAVNMTLGMGITMWIGAKVDREGAVTLPAKTFSELVNNLAQGRVDLTLDEATQKVLLECGTTRANINGIDADEFPPVPEGTDADFAINGKALKEMINQTVFAAATEDNRPILTGVLTQLEGNIMTMAAADGYRLAVRTLEVDHQFKSKIEMVIPSKSLEAVARSILDENEDVLITLPKDRDIVLFQMANVEISAQLLEGKFPDFRAIIPKRYNTSLVVDTAELLKACQRAEIFARDSGNSGRIEVKAPQSASEPGLVRVIGKSAERGDNKAEVFANVEGEELEISFNIKYLIEVLKVIDHPNVVLESSGSANPGVIRPDGSENFIHVIMPMSTGR